VAPRDAWVVDLVAVANGDGTGAGTTAGTICALAGIPTPVLACLSGIVLQGTWPSIRRSLVCTASSGADQEARVDGPAVQQAPGAMAASPAAKAYAMMRLLHSAPSRNAHQRLRERSLTDDALAERPPRFGPLGAQMGATDSFGRPLDD